jgi:microcystin-dependent protein
MAPGEYLLIDFDLVGALKGVAANLVVELNYNNLSFQKNDQVDSSVTNKISQTILNVVNFGTMGVPPQIDLKVAKGYQIINNGEYENEVVLDLINTSNAPIYFSPHSQMQLSFYTQQEGEILEYALMDKDGTLSSVSLSFDWKASDVKQLENPMLVQLIKAMHLSEVEIDTLFKKLPKHILLPALDLKSIIQNEVTIQVWTIHYEYENRDYYTNTIIKMLGGNTEWHGWKRFRLDKNKLLYCQEVRKSDWWAERSYSVIKPHVFDLEYQSGGSFNYKIYGFDELRYDYNEERLITPLTPENLIREIHLEAVWKEDFKVAFRYNLTAINEKPIPLKEFNPNAASYSLPATADIDFAALLASDYFSTNAFFKGLVGHSSKYKDYDYLYYKKCESSTKENGKKSIIITDVIAVKKSKDTYQVFRPLPNPINGLRDLEAHPMEATLSNEEALAKAIFIEEPMELLCTISIHDTAAEVHYSIQAIDDITAAIVRLVFVNKDSYKALTANLDGYIGAYYLASANENSTDTFSDVIAIKKDDQTPNLYRVEHIAAVSINNGKAALLADTKINTVYEAKIEEKVINNQNHLTATFSNISKNTCLYGDKLYDAEDAHFVSDTFADAIHSLLPNRRVLVENNLPEIFENQPSSDIFALFSSEDIAKRAKLEYPLAKAQKATTVQTTYQTENSLLSLSPSQKYQLKISGLKTQLPEGEAELRVALLNVPNYKDGYWTTRLSRVSFTSSGDKGIFTKGKNNNNISIQTDDFSIESKSYKIMPVGAVIMWYGDIEKIPGGWALCDGQRGTPDLRDRFVVGAGHTYPLKDTGGLSAVTLYESQIPSHSHSVSINETNISRGYGDWKLMHPGTYARELDDGDYHGYDSRYKDDGKRLDDAINMSHTHSAYISSTGGSQPHENRPPYYALYYIMRVEG